MIVDMISSLGRSVIKFFRALGRSGFMLFGALVGKPQVRKHFPLLVKQLHVLGVQSLLIILLSGLFIGMVLGLQGYVVLVDFSAETSLGQLVALSLLRELGPVVTALLFAGRAGSALTAEIGLMKAMGLSNGKVFTIFSVEAALIGFFGSILGILGAVGVGNLVNRLATDSFLKALTGFKLIQFSLPSSLTIILVIMFIAFLAGTLPARRAAKLDPIESLRYE